MYRLNDKKSAIKEIQKYLSKVSPSNIIVVPTGIYDDNTKLSVINFQKNTGLSESGVVDYETFTALYREYKKVENENEISNLTYSFLDFPIKPGTHRNEMIHINEMLNNLLLYYGRGRLTRPGPIFSCETEGAVKVMREIYLLDKSSEIDQALSERLVSDHKSIKRKEILKQK